ncbi:diaminopimelate decarboxylase family protein [Methanimicrococcus blatticola]|uniref:Diaminopimelate decarboxylase n=1 Tax=Methanimicrococcus blatticola TaxID=91560 RepID=A0A484F3K1_9EURY|nr:diaminopimelate decarboxylase [Methanimicrococcus blatticola]MBZ3935731.1 diaminopimelate decarboxylase [Methanimicrococcus blatticola]MCC2508149.1 diaminopimelate decarboxylase [Methanimicrococcus blatticola]TDQ68774.1 diaminopimelate decarboxylase [Methanimicrococcus blatticola]
MVSKELPFIKSQIEEIIKTHPTPFHIYDEKAIRDNAEDMKRAFRIVNGFKEFFAVKALPNPYILKILAEHGFGADCSSLPELLLAEEAGITGENIMFSSNDTPAEEFKKAKELGAIINLDDISHIDVLEKTAGLPDIVCFRYNPGPLKGGNELIGKPEEAKYGFTREQLFEGYEILKKKGVKRFGLHTMVASNELNVDYFVETARILFEVIVEISQKLDINFEFVNLGGGIGIPYRPDQERVSFDAVAGGVKKAYDETIGKANIAQPNVYFECGRVITGPYGYLITEVRHMKHIYKDYVGTDACMANLMRPGIYGAYHHITVLGKENTKQDHKYDVTGSLCENNDKFAVDRMLPEIERGDLLVIHDTGAHGFAMGFNYNGKLRSAELLLRPDGSIFKIRRAETIEDYFATLDFKGLKSFK